jgi:SAM-dependent methyltransferase
VTSAHQHGSGAGAGDADRRRLQAWWPFVAAHLSEAPATVVEIGCGPLGGFVPAMRAAGYGAIGVDPEAPSGGDYQQTEFERYRPTGPVDAVVACTSLHHLPDLAGAIDQVAGMLRPGGAVVVLEWAWERFDDATAKWCFEHATRPPDDAEPGWLLRHRDLWQESGLSWERYVHDWADGEGLHSGSAMLDALTSCFSTTVDATAPYFFADLVGIDEQAEQAAIDAGRIQPNGIRYVGVLPRT